jgi:DNA-binding transcriptional LysR family regulator
MTLDQLRVFVEVAERGHVTRAAAALHISQSAASAAIAALEDLYQIKLFDRVGRGIQLSEPGRIFLREARAVLERASRAQSVLHDLAGTPAGPIALAASQTIATYWLPRRLATFHRANPSVRLNVTIRNTHEVESAVADGEVTIGLVEGPTQHPAVIRTRLDHDQMVLVVATGQITATATRVDLRSFNWVIREPGSGTRRALEDLAAREGLTLEDLNIFLELPGNEAVRAAVEAGVGATVISRHVVAAAIDAGRLTELRIDLPQREYALLSHRDRHATLAQRALITHLTSRPDPLRTA